MNRAEAITSYLVGGARFTGEQDVARVLSHGHYGDFAALSDDFSEIPDAVGQPRPGKRGPCRR